MYLPYALSSYQCASLTDRFRAVVGVFGSLATLPLFCLGEIIIPDPQGAIN